MIFSPNDQPVVAMLFFDVVVDVAVVDVDRQQLSVVSRSHKRDQPHGTVLRGSTMRWMCLVKCLARCFLRVCR